MTVFVLHETNDDLTAARQWGEIRYINHRYINGDEITDDRRIPVEFEQNMANAVNEFKADTDYLLIVGDHLQLVAFVAMLARDNDMFQVLRWDRREKAYFPVWIGT